ncbi:MAG: SufE family protein [Bacteroidia bacterium]|nr:SufE family protein [Bacteroidia bacterium]
MAAIFIKIFSGAQPKEIVQAQPTILKDSGLIFHLSPNRQRGVKSLVERMKILATLRLEK